jgi:heme/copper-type cytochrome/quinol oxidase subunit 2
MVLLGGFSGTAAAQPEDIVCGENSDTQFSNTLQSLMSIFVVGGPVIGTVMAAYYQVAASANPDGSHQEDRKQALIAGWSVPVIVYMLQIIGSAVLGIKLGCIVPGGA